MGQLPSANQRFQFTRKLNDMELCGGTHVKNTADIWHFKIVSTSAVAAGIRRIEAITSDAVRRRFYEGQRTLEEIWNLFKGDKEPLKAVKDLLEENKELRQQLEQYKKAKSADIKSDLKNELTNLNGVQFLARRVEMDAGQMKDLSFTLGNEVENLFLLLGAENDGKALLSCYISKELAANKGLNAGQIVRELGSLIKGGGGGQPFFATAGGKDPSGIDEALTQAKAYLDK